jgi:uncharacterized protein
MPEYLSPGVYVEEVPSAVKPIAGVSTSTACFLGIIPDSIQIPEENRAYDPTGKSQDPAAKERFVTWAFATQFPEDLQAKTAALKAAKDAFDADDRKDPQKTLDLMHKLRFAQESKARTEAHKAAGVMTPENIPILCTSFADFKHAFGDFSTDGLSAKSGDVFKQGAATGGLQNQLAHAVYGFFNNGGTRCYVMRFKTAADMQNPENLEPLEAIDEISLIAAPSITDPVVQHNLLDHCEKLANRFAILDGPQQPGDETDTSIRANVRDSDYGAIYFPWIRVFDYGQKLIHPESEGEIVVGPSGHMAGIYARVDHERGVHKAPANEVVRGVLEVDFNISRNLQDGLNPSGVNCIRYINDAFRVWGARTIGGDSNADLKYINVRRTIIFLRESIDRGTQWVVFEPNDPALWAKIVRNVSAFLMTVWQDGALFGSKPEDAFRVKCDEETNPPEERDLGRVTAEIAVAIVRPAEFVIFRISQWNGPQGQQ